MPINLWATCVSLIYIYFGRQTKLCAKLATLIAQNLVCQTEHVITHTFHFPTLFASPSHMVYDV